MAAISGVFPWLQSGERASNPATLAVDSAQSDGRGSASVSRSRSRSGGTRSAAWIHHAFRSRYQQPIATKMRASSPTASDIARSDSPTCSESSNDTHATVTKPMAIKSGGIRCRRTLARRKVLDRLPTSSRTPRNPTNMIASPGSGKSGEATNSHGLAKPLDTTGITATASAESSTPITSSSTDRTVPTGTRPPACGLKLHNASPPIATIANPIYHHSLAGSHRGAGGSEKRATEPDPSDRYQASPQLHMKMAVDSSANAQAVATSPLPTACGFGIGESL